MKVLWYVDGTDEYTSNLHVSTANRQNQSGWESIMLDLLMTLGPDTDLTFDDVLEIVRGGVLIFVVPPESPLNDETIELVARHNDGQHGQGDPLIPDAEEFTVFDQHPDVRRWLEWTLAE